MRLEKAGLTYGKEIIAWIRTGKACFATKTVKVKASELGVCHPNGTIKFKNFIRYRTPEAAEAEAKKIVMRQFGSSVEQPKEIMTATVDRDLYIGLEGMADSCTAPLGIKGKGAKLFHNHPNSASVSFQDIAVMINQKAKSITAFNSAGEYCTATVNDFNKTTKKLFEELKRTLNKSDDELIAYSKEHPDRFNELLAQQSIITISNRWISELKNMERTLGKPLTENLIITGGHTANKRILPQLGIEYRTNFSNFLKFNA